MGTAWWTRVAGVPKVTLRFHTGPGEFTDVTARLHENRSPTVRAQAGADATEMVLDASIENADLPEAIKPGMTTPVEILGADGSGQLVPTVDSRINAGRRATGRTIRLVWSSDAF